MSATKAQSQKIFEKLKLKPANKVRSATPRPPVCGLAMFWPLFADDSFTARYASTVALRTRLGHRCLLVSTCVWIVPPTIAISVFTSPLSVPQISTVRTTQGHSVASFIYMRTRTDRYAEWQWEQLRVMKCGGNESATKYFQSHGGSAALASKDVKVKYTSNAAIKYKDELKRRAALDAQQ